MWLAPSGIPQPSRDLTKLTHDVGQPLPAEASCTAETKRQVGRREIKRLERHPWSGSSEAEQRAGDGIRTHDNDVGNVVLYQLSYTRFFSLSSASASFIPFRLAWSAFPIFEQASATRWNNCPIGRHRRVNRSRNSRRDRNPRIIGALFARARSIASSEQASLRLPPCPLPRCRRHRQYWQRPGRVVRRGVRLSRLFVARRGATAQQQRPQHRISGTSCFPQNPRLCRLRTTGDRWVSSAGGSNRTTWTNKYKGSVAVVDCRLGRLGTIWIAWTSRRRETGSESSRGGAQMAACYDIGAIFTACLQRQCCGNRVVPAWSRRSPDRFHARLRARPCVRQGTARPQATHLAGVSLRRPVSLSILRSCVAKSTAHS